MTSVKFFEKKKHATDLFERQSPFLPVRSFFFSLKGPHATDNPRVSFFFLKMDGVCVLLISADLVLMFWRSGVSPSVHMIDPMHFDRVGHDDVIKKW
jgi:hypothetical protein